MALILERIEIQRGSLCYRQGTEAIRPNQAWHSQETKVAVPRRQNLGKDPSVPQEHEQSYLKSPAGLPWPLLALLFPTFPHTNPIFISNKWLAGGRGRKDTY